jgi:molecular chaperone GrpE
MKWPNWPGRKPGGPDNQNAKMPRQTDISASGEPDVENQNSQDNEQTIIEDGTVSGSRSGDGAANASDAPTADQLTAELQDAKDKHIRLLAEWENFRRRTVKENFDLVSSANAKLLGKLTGVLDDFNLAFDPKHKSDKLEDVEKGMRLIYNKFKEILSEEGLTEIDPVGEEFDPNLHDALMQQPSETVPENHIAQVLQKGYKAKNKILKHAKVIVSTGKPS